MNNLFYSDFFTVLLFPSLEDLRRSKFTNLSKGGYSDITTSNGSGFLYMKLQTDRLSRELKATVTWFGKNEPIFLIDKVTLNQEIFWHVIVRDKIGWFKQENWYRILPLEK